MLICFERDKISFNDMLHIQPKDTISDAELIISMTKRHDIPSNVGLNVINAAKPIANMKTSC